MASPLLSDTMTSYVRPRTFSSRMLSYGYYHFWVNLTQHNVHEKFSFIYLNNVRRNFHLMKQHISSYHRVYVPVEKIDQFVHSFMVRNIAKQSCLYGKCIFCFDNDLEFALKLMRDYYNYQLEAYVMTYGEDVCHVPNIINIDSIGRLLEGRQPDELSAVKSRYKLGLFVAR